MQCGEGQQRMRCQNMKRGLQVLGDKLAHLGDDMKNGVKVINRGLYTQATAWDIVSKHGEGLAAENLDWWQKSLEIMFAS